MSKESKGDSVEERQSFSAQEVMAFLQGNPDFFRHFPKALELVTIPHQIEGTASLVEKQVAYLQRENRKLHEQMQDLLEVANANERTIHKLHLLTLRLLRGKSPGEILDTLYAVLAQEFDVVSVVRICLEPGALEREEFIGSNPMLEELLEEQEAACRPLNEQQREFLFGTQGEGLASFILIPLGISPGAPPEDPSSEAWRGLLCFASPDAQRFTPEVGSELLYNLGGVLTALLDVHLR